MLVAVVVEPDASPQDLDVGNARRPAPKRHELRRGVVTHVQPDATELVAQLVDGQAGHERNDRLHGRPCVVGNAPQRPAGEKNPGSSGRLAERPLDVRDARDGRDAVGDGAAARVARVAGVRAAELVSEQRVGLGGHDVGELKEQRLGGGDEKAVPQRYKRRPRTLAGADRAREEPSPEPPLGIGDDHVDWVLGALAGCFGITGHYIGSGLVMKNGGRIVRPIILTVLAILFVKTAWDYLA